MTELVALGIGQMEIDFKVNGVKVTVWFVLNNTFSVKFFFVDLLVDFLDHVFYLERSDQIGHSDVSAAADTILFQLGTGDLGIKISKERYRIDKQIE